MIYLVTQKGVNKVESEDAVLIGNEVIYDAVGVYAIPQTGFVCVADGVGGHKGGRIASHYVLNALSERAPKHEQLKNTVLQINSALLNVSEINRDLCELATTLSGIYLFEGAASILHIGNTRVYAKQGSYLKQLTADHTVYNWLNSLGRHEEAKHCNRNEIIACLGGGDSELAKRLTIVDLNRFSTLLFTSDGVHDYISIDILEELISSGKDGIEICKEILAEAIAAGSKDDITVMLLVGQEENDGISV